MKVVIVGCGRVGSTLAENFDAAGHEVIIFDIRTAAFDRLPESFRGSAVRADGTDEEYLRRAGAYGADIFLSLTEGDNRNVMAAQVATESLAIPTVIAKINDPVRAAAYAELGMVTLCRTSLMVDSVANFLKLPMQVGPGIGLPRTPGRPHSQSVSTETGRWSPPVAEAPDTDNEPAPGPAVTTNEADAPRSGRIGLPRRRG